MGKFLKNLRNIKTTLNEIREATEGVNESWSGEAATPEAWHDEFKKAWDIVKPATQLVKMVTPDKVDKLIDELVKVGEEVATKGASPDSKSIFVEKFSHVWVYIKVSLLIAMKFTNDRVDVILGKIIAWGDLISEQKTA